MPAAFFGGRGQFSVPTALAVTVEHVLLIDIDGLRSDVLETALHSGRAPHIARLLGGLGLERGLLYPLLAPAPSITFTSQASLFTGAHPGWHGIPGNQFLDRFGAHSDGAPRHYAFDVGDRLAVDDAVRVFTAGLASNCLLAPTLYEQALEHGLRARVVGHMYARGANQWIKPSLANLARFTKGGNLFGLEAADYDRYTLDQALDALQRDGLPDILTIYFMGVDHESHHHGPAAQLGYLCEVLDGYVGELWDAALRKLPAYAQAPLCLVFSDHGQIAVPSDDRHSLRLGFPFEREIGHLFDALGLDVHDIPGEDPNCDAVVASNGGVAQVYLQNRKGRWHDAPDFERDVLPVAGAFWEAHATGRYAQELQGALAGVLVRNAEQQSWSAAYQALTPQGDLVSLAEWFEAQPPGLYIDPVNRLDNLAGPLAGDLMLIGNGAEGFYFSAPLSGMHGGLHPEESQSAFALGWPGASQPAWDLAQAAFIEAIQRRCQAENRRMASTTDMLTGLQPLIAQGRFRSKAL
jgi:hypothetical protein